MLLHDNKNTSQYQVVIEGKVFATRASKALAEQYVLSLSPEEQMKAKIVPLLEDNKQLLLES